MINIGLIYEEVLRYLDENLGSHLSYHNVGHTKCVYKRVVQIAGKEQISKKELRLVLTAALFHDFGYIKGPTDHEIESCRMSNEWLKKYGFSRNDILIIHGMIMATKIPQNPNTLLECILADSDLIYLGTSEFNEQSNNLYMERKYFNPDLSISEWNRLQNSFLLNHKYHTDYCKRYFEFRKERNRLNAIKG